MERYSEYKDSGVKWLGEIPSHWEVLALKHILKLKKETVGKKASHYDLLSLTLKGIVKRDMENPEGKFPASFDTYQVVEPGDFVFCNFDNEETPRAVGLSPYKGMITGAYDVLCRKSLDFTDKFLIYYFLYIDDAKRFKPLYKGLRKTIPFDSFMSYKIPVPAITEQEAIVKYLDSVTSKIDEAIAQQQKMIDLLNERKQIIINNAVTKGLDPNVKMKPSGVDWIGDIPEHWEIYKIKNIISLLTDYDANGSFSDIANNCNINVGTPYAWMVRTTDLVNKRVGIVDGNNYCDEKTYNYLSKSSLISGDLLMTKRGNVGNVYVVPECKQPMTLAPNLYLLRTLKEKVNNKYLMYYLSSSKPQGQLALLNKSTTLGALYKDDVKALNVVIPPLTIQNELVNWIEKRCDEVDVALNSINRLISLLQERKQIIINNVVTGKVKVV